jgi:hypothetical protein
MARPANCVKNKKIFQHEIAGSHYSLFVLVGSGSVISRSLAEFTLSIPEGFEMRDDYFVVISSGSEKSFST